MYAPECETAFRAKCDSPDKWHIGGRSPVVVERVASAFDLKHFSVFALSEQKLVRPGARSVLRSSVTPRISPRRFACRTDVQLPQI